MSMRKSLAAAIAASAALAGCHSGNDDGGSAVSRNYQVGNFQQIEVAGPYNVDVRTGSNPTVSARGSEKLLERTVVEVQGDKLVIHPQENHSFFHLGLNGGKANFTVTVPQLSGATMAGSGGMKVDKVQDQRFEGTVAGSGDLDVGAMDVQQLKLSIAGSGDMKAAAGKALSADIEVVGSGNVDAAGIQAQQIKVDIAGSGDVLANATGTADVDIMGSGGVKITGGAKCNVSKMGSGTATCS